MSDFGHKAGAAPLRPVFVGEPAATKVLKTALQQMLGSHSADRAVGRANPHDPQRRMNVAQVDGREMAPTEQLDGTGRCLPRDDAVAGPPLKQSGQVAAKLMLFEVDRPRAIGRR